MRFTSGGRVINLFARRITVSLLLNDLACIRVGLKFITSTWPWQINFLADWYRFSQILPAAVQCFCYNLLSRGRGSGLDATKVGSSPFTSNCFPCEGLRELQRPSRFRPGPHSSPRSVAFLMIVWSIILWPGSKNVFLQLQSRDNLPYTYYLLVRVHTNFWVKHLP